MIRNRHSFTAKQIKCIELLAVSELTQKQIAEQLEIGQSTLSEWKNSPEFYTEVIRRARELLKISLPDIYRSLVKKAKEGSYSHIKLMLEHIEHIEKLFLSQPNISFTWNCSPEQWEIIQNTNNE